MLNWWRNLTIPQRFLVEVLGIVSLWPVAYVFLQRNFGGAAAMVFAGTYAAAFNTGYDRDFANWRPTSRGGRLLRGFLYMGYWLREGEGKRWMRIAMGLLGLAFMGLVLFGLGWAIWG